jgi:hypothetical protein
LVSLSQREGVVELLDIADNLVATELIGGVWVDCNAAAHFFGAVLIAP